MPQATRYNDLAAPRPTFRRDGEPPQADRTAQQTDEDADGDSIVNPLKGGSGRPERARWSGTAEGRWRAECSLREVTVRGFMKCGFFSPDTMLFAASGNCKLVLHSLATHRVIEELDYGHASVRAACVSPKMAGERYAFCVGTGDGSVHLYARSTGVAAGESDLVWSYQEDSKSTNCATFGKDGCVLAVGWVTGTVRLFDVLQGAATLPSAGNGGGAETVTPICEVSLGKSNINGGSLQFQSVGSAHYLAGSSPHSAQPIVNLWQLESAQDLKEPQVLTLKRKIEFALPVWAVALSEDGELAVGTSDGTVRLFHSLDTGEPFCMPLLHAEITAVSSLAFCRGQLAAGWRSGDFAVWELATVAQIAAFVHPGTNNGWLLAFTPAGDMIATGGGNACCVLHHLQPLQMVQVASVTPKKSSLGRAGSACICADIAALSCGNKISAYRYSTREKLFTVTVPDVVDHLLEISPTGDFLAAAQRFDKSVHIFTITASPEPRSRTLSFVSACDGVRWSPGGTWLLAFGAFGVALFDGATFEPACEFEDKARYTGDCHIDSDEQYIASAGASNAVTVRKLPSPGSASGQLEVAHTFQERGFTAGLCFDTTGRRIAFSVANSNDVFSVESIKICSLEAQSFGATLFHIGAQQKGFFAHPKAFSPGDGRLLACWHSQGSSNENGITIIDTVEGKIVSWSPLLSTFFRGDDKGVSRFSVGWVPAPQDRPILPLLYVAIGEALWTLDVDMFQTALQDGCLSAKQLRYLTEYRPDMIDTIAKTFPHVVHRRDEVTGDTVLHHCARMPPTPNNQSFLAQWLQVGKGSPTFYKPVANFDRSLPGQSDSTSTQGRALMSTVSHFVVDSVVDTVSLFVGSSDNDAANEGIGRFGQTALHCAISLHQIANIRVLTEQLTDQLLPIDAALMADDLAFLAWILPEMVPEALETMHDSLLQPQELTQRDIQPDAHVSAAGVRVALSREECRGSGTFNATLDVQSDDLTERQHVWRAFQAKGPNAVEEAVQCHVVALAGLLGDHTGEVRRDAKNVLDGLDMAATCTNNRTYHIIVEKCDRRVMQSPIMRLATQFKWEFSVRPLQLKILATYILGVLLSTSAMLTMTREHLNLGVGTTVLLICMLVSEFIMLSLECREIKKRGLGKYLQSPWNVSDSSSSVLLITAAALYILDVESSRETRNICAGLGLMCEWAGMMDYLRLFPSCASHVRMVTKITEDVAPFVIILLLSILGFTFTFSALVPENMDANGAFDWNHPTLGFLQPFVSIYRVSIGNFNIDDYPSQMSASIFVLMTAFLLILMLNMIIANMGDSFAKVKEQEVEEILMGQARMIVQMEANFPQQHKYCKYMHILSPIRATRNDSGLLGIAGSIADLQKVATQQHKQNVAARESMQRQLDAVQQQLDSINRVISEIPALSTN